MRQYQTSTFILTEDKDDVFLATSHEEADKSITIHTNHAYTGFYLHITQKQAEDLISKLQKSIINLEVHKRRQTEEV